MSTTDKHICLFPSSVSKYNHSQLALAFSIISKNPNVLKINLPNDPIKYFHSNERKYITWKPDLHYTNIPGLGDFNNCVMKAIMYTKNHNKDSKEVSGKSNYDEIIEVLEKQRKILNESLEAHKGDIDKYEHILGEIKMKDILIEKQKQVNNQKKKSNALEFTPVQIYAIARRVFEIMTKSTESAHKMFQEFVYLNKPVYNYEKESMGGDYVLPNSERDRRFKNDNNNWRENTDSGNFKGSSVNVNDTDAINTGWEQNIFDHTSRNENKKVSDTHIIEKFTGSRPYNPPQFYEKPEIRHKENESNKNMYVPPFLRTETGKYHNNRGDDRDGQRGDDRGGYRGGHRGDYRGSYSGGYRGDYCGNGNPNPYRIPSENRCVFGAQYHNNDMHENMYENDNTGETYISLDNLKEKKVSENNIPDIKLDQESFPKLERSNQTKKSKKNKKVSNKSLLKKTNDKCDIDWDDEVHNKKIMWNGGKSFADIIKSDKKEIVANSSMDF